MTNKKKTKSKKSIANVSLMRSDHKSVDIRKANNGYVVSSYNEKGSQTYIAKTKSEAKKYSDKMLGL
jgi:3-phenylpropionate/cinnamic acid dioxygenase small subunit|tara:strand:+ start:1569 stop:1769 length:201 start_codon:yes stop_codon:yes gene_type:complete